MYPWQTHFKDYFQVLEVSYDASIEVIQAAYKALIKKYHPDTQFDLSKEQEEIYYNKTQELNEAYEVLKNEEIYSLYKEDFLNHYNEKMKKGDLLSYYYLKNWQNALIKEQNENKVVLKEGNKDIIKAQSSFKAEKKDIPRDLEPLFHSFTKAQKEGEIRLILAQLEMLSLQKLQQFFQILFSQFDRLSLLQESSSLGLILKHGIFMKEEIIKKSFKYKFLYKDLFLYINQKKMTVFYDKVIRIAENTNFNNKESLSYAINLLDLLETFLDKKHFKSIKKSIQNQLKKAKKNLNLSLDDPLRGQYDDLLK